MDDAKGPLALPHTAHGTRLEHLGEVGSSNDEAMARARAGDPGGLWIVADAQTKGRGRSGRPWTSPPGNLFASLLLVDPCSHAVSPQLGFVAGVALHQALSGLMGDAAPRLALKWPNDLLLDGAKIAGILVEGTSVTRADGHMALATVIGLGVNVVDHPLDTPYPATDCRAAGCLMGRDALFSALAGSLAAWLHRWDRGTGFGDVRRTWLAAAGGLGGPIVVRRHGGEERGLFRDLDADGRLLLDQGGTILVVQAGDVFLSDVVPGMAPGERGDGMAAVHGEAQ